MAVSYIVSQPKLVFKNHNPPFSVPLVWLDLHKCFYQYSHPMSRSVLRFRSHPLRAEDAGSGIRNRSCIARWIALLLSEPRNLKDLGPRSFGKASLTICSIHPFRSIIFLAMFGVIIYSKSNVVPYFPTADFLINGHKFFSSKQLLIRSKIVGHEEIHVSDLYSLCMPPSSDRLCRLLQLRRYTEIPLKRHHVRGM